MSVLTEVKDLGCVLEYALRQPWTRKDQTLLMGCSQGGFVSALFAAEYPEKVRTLILFYPALCIPDDAGAGKMMRAKSDPQHVPDILYCGPMRLGRQYVTDVLEMDAFEQIRGFKGDTLIVHGEKDRIVDPE